MMNSIKLCAEFIFDLFLVPTHYLFISVSTGNLIHQMFSNIPVYGKVNIGKRYYKSYWSVKIAHVLFMMMTIEADLTKNPCYEGTMSSCSTVWVADTDTL